MQINMRGKVRKNFLLQASPFKKLLSVLLLSVLCSSTSPAQGVVGKIRDAARQTNITVGSPIVNESTEKALKVIDAIPELSETIHRYNERYGNDSVHATRFVDREPDEKNTIDKLIQNYYDVVVVSDSAHQTMRWYSFLVRKDFQEVLYYDLKNGKTAGIDDWRKLWPATEFLEPKTTGAK